MPSSASVPAAADSPQGDRDVNPVPGIELDSGGLNGDHAKTFTFSGWKCGAENAILQKKKGVRGDETDRKARF